MRVRPSPNNALHRTPGIAVSVIGAVPVPTGSVTASADADAAPSPCAGVSPICGPRPGVGELWVVRQLAILHLQRMKAFCSIVTAVLLVATVPAHARSILCPVTPHAPTAFGLAFDISAKNLPNGTVQFRVVVSEKDGKFSSHPSTALSIVKSTEHSKSIAPVRELPSERKGHSIVCVFSVEQSALDDPSLCFVFTNPAEELRDGKLVGMPAADFAFARLKDFSKRQL